LEQALNEKTAELAQAKSEALRIQRELEAAKNAAEMASRAKSDFLANISHEIRTPMSAIMGYAELLDGVPLVDSEKREWVRQLRLNAEFLLGLVGDVLDFSRIEAGLLELEIQEHSTVTLVDGVVELLRPRAEAKGLLLTVNYQNWPPCRFRTDGLRFRQVLVNLVTNAIKYTEDGEVRLEVRVRQIDTKWRLEIDVVDTGDGIPETEIDQIFDAFHQRKSNTTALGGCGLGLSITRRLVRLLHGELEVDSTVGEGSRFRTAFVLDSDEMASRREPNAERGTPISRVREKSGPKLNGLRILLADDSSDNRRLISYHLERSGALVCCENDGEAAVAAVCEAAAHGRPFDVVLMDLHMPVLNGYDTTRVLRARGYGVPVIALTADATLGARERSRRVGCDFFLTKPIATRLLAETVALACTEQGSEHLNRRRPKGADDVPLPDWIVADYRTRLLRQADLIRKLQNSGASVELRRIAHQLVGSGSSYGFPEVTACARRCERAIDAGATPMVVADRVADLLEVLDQATGLERAEEEDLAGTASGTKQTKSTASSRDETR
jgi:CheY-like chemotaxis protein/nitrogen-specific signal transduction histidine kinase